MRAQYPLPHGPAQGGCADPQAAAPAEGSRANNEHQRVGGITVGGASEQLGADLRCPDAVALVEAIRKFQRAATDDYTATYEASALRGFAKETRAGYAAELRRLARTLQRQPGASARESLQDQLLRSVRESRSDSGPRRLLSAVRILEKFGWVRPIVVAMDWKLVEAVARFHDEAHDAGSKFWASMGCLRALCRLCTAPADWELAALGAISISLGLRAKQAVTARFEDGKF